MIYPLQNFNVKAVEDWVWMSNFIPHCTGIYVYLSMLGLKLKRVWSLREMLVKIQQFSKMASIKIILTTLAK